MNFARRVLIFCILILSLSVLAYGQDPRNHKIVADGDRCPGGGKFFSMFLQAITNRNGAIVWSGNDDAFVHGAVICLHSAGKTRIVVQYGTPKPSGGQFDIPIPLGVDPYNRILLGDVAITGDQFRGIYLWDNGRITPIAEVGKRSPLGTTFKALCLDKEAIDQEKLSLLDPKSKIKGFFFGASMNDQGEVVFSATLDDQNIFSAVFHWINGKLTVVAKTGDLVADSHAVYRTFERSMINNRGDIAFHAVQRGGIGSMIISRILKGKTIQEAETVATSGDQPNGFPPFLRIDLSDISDDGQVGFVATASVANDQGYLIWADGQYQSAVTYGQPSLYGELIAQTYSNLSESLAFPALILNSAADVSQGLFVWNATTAEVMKIMVDHDLDPSGVPIKDTALTDVRFGSTYTNGLLIWRSLNEKDQYSINCFVVETPPPVISRVKYKNGMLRLYASGLRPDATIEIVINKKHIRKVNFLPWDAIETQIDLQSSKRQSITVIVNGVASKPFSFTP